MIWQEKPTLKGVLEEWPSPADRARIAGYTENRLLRHDHHEQVFRSVQQKLEASAWEAAERKWAGVTYVTLNALGMASKATAEDLFLSPPPVKFQEQPALDKALEQIASDSGLDQLLLDEIDGATVNGDLVLKVWRRAGENRVIIDAVDVSLAFRGEDYFDEYKDQNHDTRITRFPMIVTPVRLEDDSWAVVFEIHEPGLVLWRAYRWKAEGPSDPELRKGWVPSFADEGDLGDLVDMADVWPEVQDYETTLQDPTLWILHNERGTQPFWGDSDYTVGAKAIQDELNYTLSRLCDHTEDLMTPGTLVLDESNRAALIQRFPFLNMRPPVGAGNTPQAALARDFGRGAPIEGRGAAVPVVNRRDLGIVWENAQSSGVSRFLQITPQAELAFKLLGGLWAALERRLGVTLDPLFDHPKAPESGRAMRLQRHRDQRRVARKQLRFNALAQVYRAAVALQTGQRDAPLPSIQWSDPLPLSDQEKAEIISIRTSGAASISLPTALERFDGLSKEQADAEVKAINDAADARRPTGLPSSQFGDTLGEQKPPTDTAAPTLAGSDKQGLSDARGLSDRSRGGA